MAHARSSRKALHLQIELFMIRFMNIAVENSAPADPAIAPPTPWEREAEQIELDQQLLRRVARIGERIALSVERRAVAEAALAEAKAAQARSRPADDDAELPLDRPGGDAALAFTRVTRAMRLNLMLVQKLGADRLARDKADQAAEQARAKDAARVAEAARQARAGRQKAQVRHAVGIAIETEAENWGKGGREEALKDLDERLDDPDVLPDFGTLPTSEIVRRICRDLSLDPLWREWLKEPWAIDEARRQVPGSPYVDGFDDGATFIEGDRPLAATGSDPP
jgi:hypothetical protein